WMPLRATLERVVESLDRWLPPSMASEGAVSWPGGRLEIDQATWTKGHLKADSVRRREIDAFVDVTHDAGNKTWRVEARERDGQWTATVISDAAKLSGRGELVGQTWTATATFASTGWLPMDADVKADAWSVPGGRLGLAEFYATVAGDAHVVWSNQKLAVNVEVAGAPIEGSEAPPLTMSVHGTGGLDGLILDEVQINIPGVQGRLSEPVSIGADGQLRSEKSRFEINADLAKLPWLKNARGGVSGAITVSPRGDGLPLVEATLSSKDAAMDDWAVTDAQVAVRADWPEIRITRADVELAGGDRVSLAGMWNAKTRTLSGGQVAAQVSHATAARWLPEGADFESVNINATAAGNWPDVVHAGKLQAKAVQVAPLRPISFTADWRGTGAVIEEATVNADAGATRVHLKGRADAASVRVEELTVSQADQERLRLVAPVNARWAPTWTIDPFELSGARGKIAAHVEWAAQGRVSLKVQNFASAWLADVVELRGPAWTLAELDFVGNWDQGPLTFRTTANASIDLAPERRASVVVVVHGDGSGVQIDTLRASMDQNPVLQATGRLPVAIWPVNKPYLRVDDDGALALAVDTEPHALFWDQITEVTGLVLTKPEVDLRVSGTLKKPLGEGSVSVAKIGPGQAKWARQLPEIDELRAKMTGDRSGLVLESLTAKVSGQDVRASGRLPVKEWATLISDPLSLAGVDGEARIEIPDADVAALARYAPAYLAPVGKLQVDVALERGGQFKGVLRLTDAATRPLGPLGILQGIGAEIRLDGRKIEFKEVRATTGGQPVTLTGTVEALEGKEPRLNLKLKGEKLPFVRQSGLLVRGDIDLSIVTDDAGVTRITGRTQLRDSLFLMDVRALIPSGGGSRGAPGRRPPYFSVAIAPFNAWVLDVDVRGDRFLRLRTPVFTGLVSANFKLSGTLGDPRSIGEAVINQGQVLLPFANFTVRQGGVRLSEAEPFEPKISLIGTGRRYGYDLRMEVSGTAERPRLVFTSTPTLESEQVLLMVMAGEAPQNEVTYSGSERAARLGAYLGQTLLSQLGSDPAAADRFSITIGERISRQGRETYGVEYTLDPRWSLVGEYDEFDEYNLGVKWRVLTEKKKEEAANEAK
ncbi:MAG: translocation/assembly module TamB domain-containing protein, partial [Rariglobus sp.]